MSETYSRRPPAGWQPLGPGHPPAATTDWRLDSLSVVKTQGSVNGKVCNPFRTIDGKIRSVLVPSCMEALSAFNGLLHKYFYDITTFLRRENK